MPRPDIRDSHQENSAAGEPGQGKERSQLGKISLGYFDDWYSCYLFKDYKRNISSLSEGLPEKEENEKDREVEARSAGLFKGKGYGGIKNNVRQETCPVSQIWQIERANFQDIIS